jgi:putative secretion ATPase (PEP-CTERM system associated)
MFEAHFGLKTSPFQLGSDPSFYFGSQGHANALAYLKYGLFQQEGFVVITGEVGAGKTTLINLLLDSLDPEQVVAAQVLSTQLNPRELLEAICLAFGVPVRGTSKAQLVSALEAFLTAVAAGGRRALLVVDEAQNLGRREIEELRMLSNFQFGSRALLQSFLVGQPELRPMLASPSMAQVRQRVIASCHLGAMDADETRRYVEHRLQHAGWQGPPLFADDAFPPLFAATDGIPRRINVLCTRLLLATYLEGGRQVNAAAVTDTARALLLELGNAAAGGTAVGAP